MSFFSESYLKDNRTILTEKSKGTDISSFFSNIKDELKKATDKTGKKNVETKATRFIFAKSSSEIVTGFPSIMTFTRTTICLGITSISPFLGIPLLLVNSIISEKATEKDIDKYIERIEKEIKLIEKEIDKAKDDETKDNLELLLKKYKDGKEKLQEYQKKITKYKDKETNKDNNDDDFGFDDFDDFGDDDFNFDESTIQLMYETFTNDTSIDISIELFETYFIIEHIEILQEKKTGKKIVRKAKALDRKVSGTVDRKTEEVIGSLKKAINSQNREDLIKGALPRASRIIKSVVVGGALWSVSPAIAVIGALTALALNTKIKDNERQRILAQLKEELRITDEKVKDAESKGDNEKKYALMRIQTKLNTDIERIRKRI